MRYKLLISILIIYAIPASGQNLPAFRQFYFNPYLFNPAFTGTHDYTVASVFHRQQWLGFNNAPSATGFTLQYPTQDRVSLGMNIIAQETVALRTTSSQATFAYRIPITSNQFIFFGLSGVVGYNNLNLNDADYSNDPAILNASTTKFYGDANFGLLYQLGNLRAGFALPKLFGQPFYSPSDMVNVRYSQ
jgi:type IX secretion system PorP/SprF family membrane protein